MKTDFTHIDENGHIAMVDIGSKAVTEREAIAKGEVKMKSETLSKIVEGSIKKGDIMAVARIAGVMAAKRTSEIIPLCHPLQLTYIFVDLEINKDLPGIIITAGVRTDGKTGVEMEALTAVSAAALTIYDMAKAVEKTMVIQNVRLVAKRGGQSGEVLNE